jgi:hypothetical protein
MKKKSKYKPKGIRLDAVNWVLSGLKPVSQVGDALVILKAKNHSALTEVVQGRGNRDQIDVLIAALTAREKSGCQRSMKHRTRFMRWLLGG